MGAVEEFRGVLPPIKGACPGLNYRGKCWGVGRSVVVGGEGKGGGRGEKMDERRVWKRVEE